LRDRRGAARDDNQRELPMRITRNLSLAVLLALGAAGLGACHQEGPAERAGRAVDNAAANTGQAVENTGQAIKRGATQ
jgi:hypothetical protein